MLPFISQETKRNINLGGTTSQSSHEAILSHARALRNSRRDERLKEDATIKIQRWLKAQRQAQALRSDIRAQFDLGLHAGHLVDTGNEDLKYVNWTRLLVLGGANEERLARWSVEMMSGGGELLLHLFTGPWGESWLVLIRQVALLLLKSISRDPGSRDAAANLRVLTTLLTPASWERLLNDVPLPLPTTLKDIVAYLLQRNMLMYLAQAFEQVPPSPKAQVQASVHISQLLAAPFMIFNEKSSSHPTSPMNTDRNHYRTLAFYQFLTHILAIPLLPNRIPLSEIPKIVSRVPWEDLPLILIPQYFNTPFTFPSTFEDLVERVGRSSRPHILANLLTFLPPRYVKLNDTALSAYLELYTALLDGVNPGDLEPPTKFPSLGVAPSVIKQSVADDDGSTSEDDVSMDVDHPDPSHFTISSSVLSSKSKAQIDSMVSLDSRTLSRLTTMTTPSHLSSLLLATSRLPNSRRLLFRLVLSLTVTFPSKREHIWTIISVGQSGGSGLIRECWRGYVRSSPLGKLEDEHAVRALMDPANSSSWPAVLFLVSLYTHSLLTIGDDEFFSLSTTSGAAPRNPLTVDDLVAFSRQLLNIAFPLYWSEDQAKVKESGPAGLRLTWEKVRELVSGCLKGIHARDSRRPFTPPGHWLITSQVDLHSFVEAAVTEEQALSNSDSATVTTSQARHRRNGLSPRQLAHLSPRLGILNNIPFAIPFEVRVEIFRHFIRNDYTRTFGTDQEAGLLNFRSGFERARRKRAIVRRENISQDGFDQLSNMGTELKGSVEIQFVDKFGQEEAGIDGGGVFKEFLTSLSKEVFDTNRGLWLSTALQELYPNPHSYATEPHQLNWYKFIGRILGKALYEGILVDVAFASFFLSKWLGKQSYLDDLASLDPELYNGLIYLKHYNGSFEELSLNFTISEEDLGVARTVNLVPNGDQLSVTRENRLQYIYLVSHYRLSRQIKRQSEAFFEGLSDIIDPKWLRMFNQQEVQILVGGVNAPIDLDDLRQNCNYGGLYDDSEGTIQMFWKVTNSFDHEQRRGLLRFVTSCSRPPLLGFKELYPKFSIRDSSSDEQRLPTSSTCVNLLKLPRYTSEKVMRDKLLQAINSGAGFDLS